MKCFWCVPWLALACSNAGASTPLEVQVSVHAQSTDGTSLAGVRLEASERRAVSGPDGAVGLTLSGSEGERREIGVTCPEDYEAASSSLVISIRRSADSTKPYHYDVTCTPLRHSVVVVARAVNGPNLPLLHLGAEIARTNEQGVAHAIIRVPAGESLRLTLDTENRGLLPEDPTFDFPAIDRDDIVTVNQIFDVPRTVKIRRPASKPKARPTRL
jgi:hypothetical protein